MNHFRSFATLAVIVAALVPGAGRSAGSGAVPASAVSPERLERLSRAYLGVPYKLDCLGEGHGPDADPLYTRDYADCQTLVEQVMAEAIAPYVGGVDAAIRMTRYYGREPQIENRYHYCVPDWLEHPWPARDITAKVGGKAVVASTRHIDRGPLLARAGGDP
ncbi:MAG TPA: N-acetylmuramoyl-L-alanine amidase-like domain-containing protein, partial [Armatimonadota bacterium]|nr:N-acetylmuramoyl-L-alanine amidase-like domain-containing protein [Armatimonadota bacterium]